MSCPHHKIRDGLPPLTERIAKLPVDERGYPVPHFVAWINGKPDFRIGDPGKLIRCAMRRHCWVCGDPLGARFAFVIGPMCAINRVSSEPPSHVECAEWSVKGCPFLSRPAMVRREDEVTAAGEENVAGIMLKGNPGVMAIWVTKGSTIFSDGQGRPLFEIGPPDRIGWWREGRPATRAEIDQAIEKGLPQLVELAKQEPTSVKREKAQKALENSLANLMAILPPA